MALIKCPECGKEVSDKAVACIHCGYPIREMIGQKELPDLGVEEKAKDASGGITSPKSSKAQSQKIPLMWLIAFLIIGMLIWQNYSPGAKAERINSQALKADEIAGVWDFGGSDITFNSDNTIEFGGCDYLNGKWSVISEEQNLILITYTVPKEHEGEYSQAVDVTIPDNTIYQFTRTDKKLSKVNDENSFLYKRG